MESRGRRVVPGLIDAHVHLYPAAVDRDPAGWAEARGERHWAVLCTRRRRSGQPVQTLPTPAMLLAVMDAAAIERAVLVAKGSEITPVPSRMRFVRSAAAAMKSSGLWMIS